MTAMIVCTFEHAQWRWARDDRLVHGQRDRTVKVGVEAGGPPLVDCVVVVWCYYGGCAVVLKASSRVLPGRRADRLGALGGLAHGPRLPGRGVQRRRHDLLPRAAHDAGQIEHVYL